MQTDRQTNSMHADRVLGDGSWTRGKHQAARMSLVTNKRVSTDSNSRSNVPRGKKWRAVLLLRSPRAHVLLSTFWLRATSTMRDRRSLSRVQHTNPGLACPPDKAQVEVRVPQADRQTCRAVGVSRDRPKVRRLLSGLPASSSQLLRAGRF